MHPKRHQVVFRSPTVSVPQVVGEPTKETEVFLVVGSAESYRVPRDSQFDVVRRVVDLEMHGSVGVGEHVAGKIRAQQRAQGTARLVTT